ncbi:hypothetical protein GUJ93_ZPchr0010g8676 [Zizania palustris]|uniref:Uncharacterized protein n=1 Tax=Zizania palustris TaxID=103762 RepID=A0A8J6BMW1_ZIZPA|nr:hypothetical protein GUJ93_ZPchr0010g8676 [Zizania palustris]
MQFLCINRPCIGRRPSTSKQSLPSPSPSHLLNHNTRRRISSTDMACHQRSISLPSRPHSNVEQELCRVETCTSSPSMTIETISNGLRSLGDIYSSIEDIMCLPSNQIFSSQQRTLLEGEMECSLETLDLCNAMHEVFAELKDIIQDMQVSLRRGDDAIVQAKIQSYIRLVKKAKKHFKKTVKKVTSDEEDCRMVKLLSEARDITTSLLESAMYLLSKQIATPKCLSSPNHSRRKTQLFAARSSCRC